jgi:hypothetical protein
VVSLAREFDEWRDVLEFWLHKFPVIVGKYLDDKENLLECMRKWGDQERQFYVRHKEEKVGDSLGK